MATKGKEVAELKSSVPAIDESEFMGYEGAGSSGAAEDNLIPILRVLQDLSPQVKKRDPEYIEGAEAGMVYLKGQDLVWPADDGPEFISCHFEKGVVEWVPRSSGGGFVAQYKEMPEFAQEYEDEKSGRTKFRNPENGNELVETRFHFGLLKANNVWQPAVLSFSSTGHTVSKGWMTQIRAHRHPESGKLYPAWFMRWRLNTVLKQKNDDSWFVMDPQFVGYVEERETRDAGKALYESVVSGERRADLSEDDDGIGDTF
jgi:hypothetical protein